MVTPNDETPIVEESPLAGDSEATPKVPRKKKRDKKKKKKTKTRDDDDDEEKRDDEVADDGDDDKSTSDDDSKDEASSDALKNLQAGVPGDEDQAKALGMTTAQMQQAFAFFMSRMPAPTTTVVTSNPIQDAVYLQTFEQNESKGVPPTS